MNIDKLFENLNNVSIGEFFDQWQRQKDVFIVKYDGFRINDKYTIIILGDKSRFDTINIECENILNGIEEVLIKYKKILEKDE